MKQDTLNKLNLEEIRLLSPEERSKYYERYLFELIKLHFKEGLMQAELEKLTGINANTLSKYLELLTSKRKVFRSKKGKSVIYYPNGKIAHSLMDKDLILADELTGFEKRYRLYLIENPEGQLLYIQEKELDENGFENVVAGITIPKSRLYDFIRTLSKIDKQEIKALED
ncbi:MAG: hypothetical protein AABY22_33425 [Nanoarchaeota archaeon]